MKPWKEWLERMFSAIAFAEANDPETAREMMDLAPSTPWAKWNLLQKISKVMTAITFAEADCPEIAREYLGVSPEPKVARAPRPMRVPRFAEVIGLGKARLYYGVAELV